MTPTSASRSKKKTSANKRGKATPHALIMTSWTRHEQGLMPTLLAVMTRTLPGVLAEHGGVEIKDERGWSRIIEEADERLLGQMEMLAQVPPEKRLRYWRALLAAMIEDRVVTVRLCGRKGAA